MNSLDKYFHDFSPDETEDTISKETVNFIKLFNNLELENQIEFKRWMREQ